MSGGTPVGGGFMRQRHSQGYTSGSDDLEDDACSRASPQSPSSLQQKTRRRWVEITENVLWIASAVFIIYYGDRHSNFIVILWHDDRIRRIPLYLGMVGVGLNIIFFLYTSMLAWNIRKSGFPLHCGQFGVSWPCLLWVLAVYGWHGLGTLPDLWDIEAATQCSPYRLNFLDPSEELHDHTHLVAQDSLIHWDPLSLKDLACLQLKLELNQTVEVSNQEESLSRRLLPKPQLSDPVEISIGNEPLSSLNTARIGIVPILLLPLVVKKS
ncbi:unnamed protein product [Camellia sinensis]